jgi:hypothetical protein
MPCPFPGMDPYLENRRLWPVFHKAFLSALMFELNEFLPEGFVASQDERVYLAPADREIQPDSVIFEAPVSGIARSSSAAVLEEDPPLIVEATPEEQHEPFIEILTAGPEATVVTVIELLSPKNKYRSGQGWQEYRKKQREMLHSNAHFIEMDLLRGGNHTVAVDEETIADKDFDYLICLHRAGTGNRFELWPVRLARRLPRIRIPLTPEHPDLIFDLQVPFERTYDGGRFAWRIEYGIEPTPRLSPSDKQWADALLREAGLRENRKRTS